MSTHSYMVDGPRCTGCAGCASVCPVMAIDMAAEVPAGTVGSADPKARIGDLCTGCGDCARFCPVGAIARVPEGAGHA